ncbi:MAG: hypothetical protein AABW85_04705 [archaeon]
MKFKTFLGLAIALALFSGTALAFNIGGVDGRDSKNFTPGSAIGYDDWPQVYKDACEKHMRAVIKKCTSSGYGNWAVSRMFSSTKFLPEVSNFSVSDTVIGKQSCSYSENSLDDTLSSGAILNFACSEKDFLGSTATSDEYSCSFTCSAWDCDDGASPNDIYACSVKAENIKGNVDPFDQMYIGCQDTAEKQCKDRSKWWKLSFCNLEKPCEFKNQDEYFGDVFCKCNCPAENPASTIDEATLQGIISDTFNLNTPINELNLGNRNGCFGDKVVPGRRIDSQTSGGKTDSIPGEVKQRILDNTTLNFSDSAGRVPKDPTTGTSIIGQINSHNKDDITTLINGSNGPAAALLGARLGTGAVQRNDTYVLLSGPHAENSIERESKVLDLLPPEEPQEIPTESGGNPADLVTELPKIGDILKSTPFDPVGCASFGISKLQEKACKSNSECTAQNNGNEWYCSEKTGCCETTNLTKLPSSLKRDSVLVASTDAGKATLKMIGAMGKPTSDSSSDLTVVVSGNSGAVYSVTLSIADTDKKKILAGTIGKEKVKEEDVKFCLAPAGLAPQESSHGIGTTSTAAYLQAGNGRIEIPTFNGQGIEVSRSSTVSDNWAENGKEATSENLKCFFDAENKKGSRLTASITSQIDFSNGLNQQFNNVSSHTSSCTNIGQDKVDMTAMCGKAKKEALAIGEKLQCPATCPKKELFYDEGDIAVNINKSACAPTKNYRDVTTGIYFFCMESVYVRCFPDYSKEPCDISIDGTWNRKVNVDVSIGGAAKDTFTVSSGTGDVVRGGSCMENWSCVDWGAWNSCSGGTQSRERTCTDANNCGTTANKPPTTESRSCSDTVTPCTESWSCGEYGAWGAWGACQDSQTQSRTRTRTCTDANNCGTTNSKPQTTETESQSCTYTPTEEKPEYSSHSSSLGSNVESMNYASDSKTFNLGTTGGTHGYKILNIPSHATVKICVSISSGTPPEYHSYPQYHYGYDWSSAEWEAANPGCMTAYNKNAWANGILVHLGDPTPVTATGTVTVSQYNQ